jgi:hypothetical protein
MDSPVHFGIYEALLLCKVDLVFDTLLLPDRVLFGQLLVLVDATCLSRLLSFHNLQNKSNALHIGSGSPLNVGCHETYHIPGILESNY